MKRFIAFSIFILIIATAPAVSGQTLYERMQKAGKVYFYGIRNSHSAMYLVLDEAEGGIHDFSGVAKLNLVSNERVKVTNSKGEYQAEVTRVQFINKEFIDQINSELLGIIKKHFPPGIEIVQMEYYQKVQDEQYFLLEVSANNNNARNQWLVQKTGSGSTQDLLFCYNEYDVILQDMARDFANKVIGAKSPKELISLNYKVKYSSMKVAKDLQPEALRPAFADLEKMITQSALDGLKDFETKSQKSLTKAMAK